MLNINQSMKGYFIFTPLTGLQLWIFYIHGRPVQGGEFPRFPWNVEAQANFFIRFTRCRILVGLTEGCELTTNHSLGQELILVTRIDSCDKNWYLMTRMDFLSSELINSCSKKKTPDPKRTKQYQKLCLESRVLQLGWSGCINRIVIILCWCCSPV